MNEGFELSEELKIFLFEGYEFLDQIERDLTELERSPGDNALVQALFRALHTLKGNSGLYELKKLEVLCHRGETLLSRLREGTLDVTPDIVSALLGLSDCLRESMVVLEHTGTEPEAMNGDVLGALEQALARPRP
jgi:two-component system chemotaxis sensor kinase CheA